MTRVLFIITTLDTGGAETMLFKLVKYLDSHNIHSGVLCLGGKGAVANDIEALGIQVKCLDIKGSKAKMWQASKLLPWVRQFEPDIIHCWMYHACLLGSFAAFMYKRATLFWSIHNTSLAPEYHPRSTRMLAKCLSWISSYPTRILYHSLVSQNVHEFKGYGRHKSLLIPNGFDTHEFRVRKKNSFKEELGLPESSLLVAFVSRMDPQKDIPTFLRSAKALKASMPDVYFICCGTGLDKYNHEWQDMLVEYGLQDCVHSLGVISNVNTLLPQMDLLLLTSLSESFPSVLGEAMLCGVLCVSTDVGEAAKILGDTGLLVPALQPKLLAEACEKLLKMNPEQKAEKARLARQHIVDNFDILSVARMYEFLYEKNIKRCVE
ncbi:MAG: glycosyltransferase [Planctomycetes bacterium]|nr:glycosyltransferase [Planctomycetota bacterium]